VSILRVLVINNGIWPSGAQISTNEFIELLKNYAEIKILTCQQEKYLIKISASVHRLPCRNIGVLLIMHPDHIIKNFVEWADIIWIATGEFEMPQRIKQIKNIPIVAHLHSYEFLCPFMTLLYASKEVCKDHCTVLKSIECKLKSDAYLTLLGASRFPHRLIMSAGSTIIWTPLYYLRWKKIITNSFNNIDGFIAVSKILRDLHIQYFPRFKEKPFETIYNLAIEPLKYVKPDPREPYSNYVLYASGSNLNKGPHLFLEAWPTISKEFKDLKLYIVGCKNSWVERMAKKMNLKNIIFFERLPSDEYYNIMYRARAVVMPSIWPEPFGRIPVEANRLGVPAVVSSAGGLPETIVDGVTGYIFKAGDADDLAEKIMKVLEKDFDREEIIKHSYEKINPQKEVEKLINFFESVISREG
jgi:glycosyltransferase involved in cell wall biosynthesis